MNAKQFEEAKVLWKMFYAGERFKHCRSAAQHITDHKLEKEHPLFQPLLVAVYTLYAKPFRTSRGVGKLSEDIIPQDRLELHEQTLIHRDKIYAHRDAKDEDSKIQIDKYGLANQVRALRLLGHLHLLATDFHSRYPIMSEVVELCASLQKKTEYHVEKLWTRYHSQVPPKVGEYLLNVLEDKGDLWLPAEPMILTKQ
jgi:hypothetical protein